MPRPLTLSRSPPALASTHDSDNLPIVAVRNLLRLLASLASLCPVPWLSTPFSVAGTIIEDIYNELYTQKLYIDLALHVGQTIIDVHVCIDDNELPHTLENDINALNKTLMRIAERVEYRIAQRRKHHLLYRAMIFGGSRDAVMALREELEGARQSFKMKVIIGTRVAIHRFSSAWQDFRQSNNDRQEKSLVALNSLAQANQEMVALLEANSTSPQSQQTASLQLAAPLTEPSSADGEIKGRNPQRIYVSNGGFRFFDPHEVDIGEEYYHIGDRINSGEYVGRLNQSHRQVIVKQYNTQSNRKRFLVECRILRQVWHQSLPAFLGSSRETDGRLFAVLEIVKGEPNIIRRVELAFKSSVAEGFSLALRVAHGLIGAIAYVWANDMFFDIPWVSRFDVTLVDRDTEVIAKVNEVGFGKGSMDRPEFGVPRTTLREILLDALAPNTNETTSNGNYLPVLKLWSAAVRSLCWKRIAPGDGRIGFFPQVRDELAALQRKVTRMLESSGRILSPSRLDVARHELGLFAPVLLARTPDLHVSVGDIGYFNSGTSVNSNSQFVKIGNVVNDGVPITPFRVEQVLYGQWKAYNTVNMMDGSMRHSFVDASQVHLHFGWSGSKLELDVKSFSQIDFSHLEPPSSTVFLISGARKSLGEAYFYWTPKEDDEPPVSPQPIHFHARSGAKIGEPCGFWSFNAEAENASEMPQLQYPENPVELEHGQDPPNDMMEFLPLKRLDDGRFMINDGGWDDPPDSFDLRQQTDLYLPTWLS